MTDQQYDAIVIGTGISGGWAAKELCENGLKTLVLERVGATIHRHRVYRFSPGRNIRDSGEGVFISKLTG